MSEPAYPVAERWLALVRTAGLPAALAPIAEEIQGGRLAADTATCALRVLHQVLLPPAEANALPAWINARAGQAPSTQRLGALEQERAALSKRIAEASHDDRVGPRRAKRDALLEERDALQERLRG